MRKKLKEEQKKPSVSVTINEELDKILEEYLKENNIPRSRYIENLIRKDFENRGYNVDPDFEK
jgi:metal-responsive CopG/Arc/MetJ family transcriptional regulator